MRTLVERPQLYFRLKLGMFSLEGIDFKLKSDMMVGP
jgi:hypothetical protein